MDGCSTAALMPSIIPVATPMPNAMADSVRASGDATPSVSTLITHMAAEMMPMMPATTLRILLATSMISETAAMLFARTS